MNRDWQASVRFAHEKNRVGYGEANGVYQTGYQYWDAIAWEVALNLEIDTQMTPDQIPIVHLKGEIDLHTCSDLRDTLRDLIEKEHYQIIINLAEVPYLDSAALGVLVDAVRRVREHEGGISLVSTTPFVRRAFEITRLVKIFQLYDDNEAALSTIHTQAK